MARVLLAALAVHLLLQLVFAVQFRLDYYDSYENLLNARTVAGLEPRYYHALRPALPALLFSPLFLLERAGLELATILTTSHVLAVLFGSATLLATHRLLRLDLDGAPAAAGALLLALLPILNHYIPMARDDIPAMLLVTLAFTQYLRLPQKPDWRWWLCGLLLGLAMAIRYNLTILVPFVLAIHQLASGGFRRDLIAKILLLGALPLAVFLLIPCITYPLAGHSTFASAIPQFIADFRFAAANQAGFAYEPASRAYLFLADSLTWPVLLLALAGTVIALRRREGSWLFMLIWTLVFMLFQAHAVSLKEARYLFIVYPPLMYFAALALREAARWFQPRPFPAASLAMVLVAILAWPAYLTACVFIRFTDPVYRVPFEQESAALAADLAGPNALWWVGDYYPIYPRDYQLLPHDKFSAIYHFAPHVVQLLSRRVPQLASIPPVPPGQRYDPNRDLHRLASLVPELSDGDALIINPDPFYSAPIAPPTPRPLVIMQVGITLGELEKPASIGAGQLIIYARPDGLFVEGTALPPEPGVLQLLDRDGKTPLVVALTPSSAGQISRQLTGPRVPSPDTLAGFRYIRPAEVNQIRLPR